MRTETLCQGTLKMYVPLKEKLQEEHLTSTSEPHRLQHELILLRMLRQKSGLALHANKII